MNFPWASLTIAEEGLNGTWELASLNVVPLFAACNKSVILDQESRGGQGTVALLLSLPTFPKMKPQAIGACDRHLKASGLVLFSRVVFVCCGLCVVHPHLCGNLYSFDPSTPT